MTPAARAGFAGAIDASAVGGIHEGLAYLRVESQRSGESAVEVVREKDGMVVGLVDRIGGDCVIGSGGSAFHIPITQEDRLFLGYAPPLVTSAQWQTAVISFPSLNTDGFRWAKGFGSAWSTGSVRYVDGPLASSLSLIDPGGKGQVDRIAGENDLVVYAMSLPERTQLHAATTTAPATPVVLYDSPTGGLAGLAVSKTVILWTSVHGPKSIDGLYASAEWSWANRTSRPTDVSVVKGPLIPAVAGLTVVGSDGDIAATIGLGKADDAASAELHVVRLSSKKTWRVRSRPGFTWGRVLVAADGVIVVTEATRPTGVPGTIDNLVRLQVAELDAIAARW